MTAMCSETSRRGRADNRVGVPVEFNYFYLYGRSIERSTTNIYIYVYVNNGKCSEYNRAHGVLDNIILPTLPPFPHHLHKQDGNKKLIADRNKVGTG